MFKKILIFRDLRLAESIRFCIECFFRKNSYNIIFYYPSHFIRSESKDNEYFEPLYKICEQRGISYLILEEPAIGMDTPRAKRAIPFDFILLLVLIARKLLSLDRFKDFYEREWHIAKKIKTLLLRKLHYDNVIVISNSMVGFFHGMDTNAKIFDYQHGIIYPSHEGYVSNGSRVPEHIYKNEVHPLLYGQLFKEMLTKHTDSDYYEKHAYVIGKKIDRQRKKRSLNSKKILFSLQIAGDEPERDRGWIKIFQNFLERNSDFFISNGLKIVFKRHPRYTSAYDDSSLYTFEFTELYEGPLDDALNNCFIHITLFSTVVFDAAAVGIPTLLWDTRDSKSYLYTQYYNYPIKSLDDTMLIRKISDYLKDPQYYEVESEKVFNWFNYCYMPLNADSFVSTLKKPQADK